ncbi:aldehyde dehydrogenase (NADP(+)) [Eudoraea chungangensis]|uniref:aldehyde dehydrogenase (NADP(+)) n=1 Tax=Eudoraea chungangensis TaxID=1481905 RepID=UPI0023EDF359|nr:aldehyde dehydrogenase (NADP(+)) [Eudoraea chungangensis]
MITGQNYLGNKRSSKGEKTYKTFNPRLGITNEWTFYEATQEELEEAARLAQNAFISYRNISPARRAGFLRVIADEIEALGNTLIETYSKETALPEGRAKGERGRTVGQLRSFANALEDGSWVEASIDTAIPDRSPIPKPDLRKMLIPIGPVAVFGSSNFPLAYSTAGGDTASALAAGCPVIVKSHPMHAATGELVASAIISAAKKTDMPNGVFSNLNSSGIEVGQALVKHPGITAVGFTGSIKGGTALYKLANERAEPIPVFAEMGSVNPVLIFPSALSENGAYWANQYASSIMLGAGQFCTNPGLIFGVKGKSLDNFKTTLGKDIAALDPSCMLHPTIYDNYEKGKKEAVAQEGITQLNSPSSENPSYFAQQLVLSVSGKDFSQNPKLHQEVFGPFSIVVECESPEEIQDIIKELEGQLTGTVLGDSNELKTYSEVIDAMAQRVGRIIYNGVPTGVEVCPSMVHGGPFPASSDSRFTAVGTNAIKRWVRPFSYQNWPNEQLPDALKNENPLNILRFVNGSYTDSKI